MCRAWVNRSRPYLWESIRLADDEIERRDLFKFVLDSSTKYPTGVSYTRTLRMANMDVYYTHIIFFLLPSKFATLTTLILKYGEAVIEVPRVEVLSSTVTALAVSHLGGWPASGGTISE